MAINTEIGRKVVAGIAVVMAGIVVRRLVEKKKRIRPSQQPDREPI